jgi:hypothetical protein
MKTGEAYIGRGGGSRVSAGKWKGGRAGCHVAGLGSLWPGSWDGMIGLGGSPWDHEDGLAINWQTFAAPGPGAPALESRHMEAAPRCRPASCWWLLSAPGGLQRGCVNYGSGSTCTLLQLVFCAKWRGFWCLAPICCRFPFGLRVGLMGRV